MEAPTFIGALQTFRNAEADVHEYLWMATAWTRMSWRPCCSAWSTSGQRPKFVYTIPTFQNPAGVSLSLERRRALVDLAHPSAHC